MPTNLRRRLQKVERQRQAQADAKIRALIAGMTGDEFLACMTEILYRAEAAHGPLEVSSEEVIETDRTGYDNLLRSVKRDLIAWGEYAPPERAHTPTGREGKPFCHSAVAGRDGGK